MSLHTPQSTTNSRQNTILNHTTKVDLRPQYWEQGHDSLGDLVDELVEHMPEDEAWSIGVLVESLAEQMATGKTHFDGEQTTIDLAQGHHGINQLLAPETLEKAEAHGLIQPASIYDGHQRHTPNQIARRTLWDFGDIARDYLDMEAVRGLNTNTNDLRSDPNEGMVHRFMVRMTEHYYIGQDDVDSVRTYVRAGNVANVDDELADRRYDLVAYEADGSIHATCEIETKPVDREHIVADAKLHAHLPGDSDWVTWRKQDLNRLLDTFVKTGAITLPAGHPGWECTDIWTGESMERLERVRNAADGRVPSLESAIVTSVNTVDNIRALAQDVRPEVFHSTDF